MLTPLPMRRGVQSHVESPFLWCRRRKDRLSARLLGRAIFPSAARLTNQNSSKGGNMAEGDQAEPLSEEIKSLVRGANFGHLATLMRDGESHIDPVWIDLEGDKIIVCSGIGSLKAKHTKRDS